MSAEAGPWEAKIGNALVGRFRGREDAQKACNASRFEGLIFVTHLTTGERWIMDFNTNAWRPFVPVARSVKERRQQREPAGGYWWQEKD
jgi:hypothetical protein